LKIGFAASTFAPVLYNITYQERQRDMAR